MTNAIIVICVYLFVYPILFRLMAVLHTEMRVKPAMEKARKNKAKKIPKPIWSNKWGPRLSFAFKDKRVATFGKSTLGSLQNRQISLIIYILGMILMVYSTFSSEIMNQALGYVAAFCVFLIAVFYAMNRAKSVVDVRNNKIGKMFEIAAAKLSISRQYAENPNAVVEVKEWRDLVYPQEVKFYIPPTLDQNAEDGFLRQFNQVFGSETTFVTHNTQDNGNPGWDGENGEYTIKAVPPLPMKAPWSEKYVLDERIAWSFFPIALGVENGVELVDPETGEKENVLGFDLAGEQVSLAKKHGVKLGGEIVVAPMVLIAGGTGGGKAEDINTKVLRYVED